MWPADCQCCFLVPEPGDNKCVVFLLCVHINFLTVSTELTSRSYSIRDLVEAKTKSQCSTTHYLITCYHNRLCISLEKLLIMRAQSEHNRAVFWAVKHSITVKILSIICSPLHEMQSPSTDNNGWWCLPWLASSCTCPLFYLQACTCWFTTLIL